MNEETKEIGSKEEMILSNENKIMLINTINKKGFFLEEMAYGILEQRQGIFTLKKNFIPKNYNKFFKERIEIDLVFAQSNKNLIIECKKTDFAWIFPKSLVGSNNFNCMVEYEDGMRVKSFDRKEWRVCYSEPMAIMINEDGKTLVAQDKEKKYVKTQPRQEDPIQRAVLQVLHQTKAWRWEPESMGAISFFIPVILTNAPLFFLDYDVKHIDKNSNLKDYNYLKKVKGIIYNYSEFLDWPDAKDEAEIKSIFIINIHHFTEFLDWIMLHDLVSLSNLINLKDSEKYSFL